VTVIIGFLSFFILMALLPVSPSVEHGELVLVWSPVNYYPIILLYNFKRNQFLKKRV